MPRQIGQIREILLRRRNTKLLHPSSNMNTIIIKENNPGVRKLEEKRPRTLELAKNNLPLFLGTSLYQQADINDVFQLFPTGLHRRNTALEITQVVDENHHPLILE